MHFGVSMKKTNLSRLLYIAKYMFFDILMIALTYIIAVFMFMVIDVPVSYDQIWIAVPGIIVYKLIVFYVAGLYRMLENHIGFEDVIKISIVTVVTNVILVLFIAITGLDFMYKSAYFFITVAEVLLITLPRVANRIIMYVKTNMEWRQALGKRTLIVGAGSAGEIVVKEIIRNRDLNNIPVAFLDDNVEKIGKILMGIKIVGPVSAIKYYIDAYRVEEVIVAINNYPLSDLASLVELVSEKKVKMKRLLSISDLDVDGISRCGGEAIESSCICLIVGSGEA